jgi:serine/threonine protein kinase
VSLCLCSSSLCKILFDLPLNNCRHNSYFQLKFKNRRPNVDKCRLELGMEQCTKCKRMFENPSDICPFDGHKHKSDPLIGAVIEGKYLLERRIGQGGMGTVYAARHTKFNKQVAIKILPKNFNEQNPDAFRRFEREAEASARIKHPNAVPVIDFGQTSDDINYLVMEYVEGMPLRQILKDEIKLAPERVVNIARQICAGISAAHNANVIHRDLKPDNVMIEIVDNRETARVLDFGIAKLKDSQLPNLTDTGNLLGTPSYMSPEQCDSGKVDQRSDLYSLGIMLYEMLSGEVPFNGPNAASVIVQHVTKLARPISDVCPEVPEPLARVVMHTLEKDPDRRPQSAADLSEQLEAALSPDANQWRVVFHGLLDSSQEGRQRFIDGLQNNFGLSAAQAEQLINAKLTCVKKSPSFEEANKLSERLRAIGADIRVESIISGPSLDTGSRAQTNTIGSETAVPTDPLLVTDGFEMLSYAAKKAKGQTDPLKKLPTSPIGMQNVNTEEVGDISEQSTIIMNGNASGSTHPALTKTEAMPWMLDVNGAVYENITEEEIEVWIREGRVVSTNKARRGAGQWYEIGSIPRFRRVFDEINSQTVAISSSSRSGRMEVTDEKESKVLFWRLIKVAVVLFVLYIGGSIGWLYFQRLLIQDDLRAIFIDRGTNVLTIREKVQTALNERGIKVPEEDIHITADFLKQRASVLIDYKRSLLFFPLKYQAKRENTNLKITMDQLAQLQDNKIELVGVTREAIARYKQELAEKRAADDQFVPDRPLNERDALILGLRNCENGDCPKNDLIIKAARAAQ